MAKIDELIRAVNCLTEKVGELKTSLRIRNIIDQKGIKRDIDREKSAMWERRYLIVVICILAGIDVAKFTGLI